jgi:hypothetical protein
MPNPTGGYPVLKPKNKKLSTVMKVGAVLVPVFLAWFQGRMEAKKNAQEEAKKASVEVGQKVTEQTVLTYEEMTKLVRELQTAVKEQHDYIVKLDGHVEAMEEYCAKIHQTAHVQPRPVSRPKPDTDGDGISDIPEPPPAPALTTPPQWDMLQQKK